MAGLWKDSCLVKHGLGLFFPSVVFSKLSHGLAAVQCHEILLKFRVQKSEIRLEIWGPLCGLQTADSSSCPHVGREQERVRLSCDS